MGNWLGKLKHQIRPRVVLFFSFPVLLLCILSRLSVPSAAGTDETFWLPEDDRPSADLSGSLTTLGGQQVPLKDLHNKALLLNVWATWCGPCRIEMPYLAELHESLSAEGLSIVAISSEAAQTVQAYLDEAEVKYPFPMLLDTDGILSDRFGIYGFPTTVVIDPKGRLALQHVGIYSWNSPEAIQGFRRLMGE